MTIILKHAHILVYRVFTTMNRGCFFHSDLPFTETSLPINKGFFFFFLPDSALSLGLWQDGEWPGRHEMRS